MLKDNDLLADPTDLVKAHRKSTGHQVVLLLGGYGMVTLVDPRTVNCIWCMDSSYRVIRGGIEMCSCVTDDAIARARGEVRSD